MLTIQITENDCNIEGSASCQEIMAACSALLHTTYEFLQEESIMEETFEEFLDHFGNMTTKAYHALSEKEKGNNDNTRISTRPLRKLS